jgi:RimJ/RimL family protein N-acetyltransferase
VRATGAFIGYVGLWPADHVAPGTVEVGWRLAARAWGHGNAPEAAAKVLRFGFEDLGLAKISSFTVPQNVNSLRVMDKIGLRRVPERDFDHPLVDPTRAAHLVRHVVDALTADEWRRRGRRNDRFDREVTVR